MPDAWYRMLQRLRSYYPRMAAIIVADSLYSKQPFVEKLTAGRFSFLLVMGLRSADSAVACAPLFAGFAATMPLSDFFGSFIFGPASRLSSAVPATTTGAIRRPPRSRCMTYVRA